MLYIIYNLYIELNSFALSQLGIQARSFSTLSKYSSNIVG